jgi:hypothetical protein
MPKLINKTTGEVVREGPYGGPEEKEFLASAKEEAKGNPDLEVVSSYWHGGLLHRSPPSGYKSKVHEARGGGAARRGTRFYKVSADK